MIFELRGHSLTVKREGCDRAFPVKTAAAAGESTILYHVKGMLNCAVDALGVSDAPFIKKRMWRDGHLQDEYQQYIRTNKKRSDCPNIYLYNGHFASYGIDDVWNDSRYQSFTLEVETDVWRTGKTDDLAQLAKMVEFLNSHYMQYAGDGRYIARPMPEKPQGGSS